MEEKHILLLDDDYELLNNLKMFFEDENYHVVAFEEPNSALAHLNKNFIDVCVVDMRLPIKSGEEFILEAYSSDPNIKFLIYTGSADYGLSDNLKSIGIKQCSVFSKPIQNMNKFIEQIKKIS